jgi:toxin ParE1/3/4
VRVKWLRNALANLDAEARYISEDSPSAASSTVLAIVTAVEQLKKYPAMGRPGRVTETRELVVPGTPYIVPYRVRMGVIEIIRVLHGARKWPEQF